MTRARKRIADGGTAPHADVCTCGVTIIRHRRIGSGFVALDYEPVEDGRFVLFGGAAIHDPDPRNLPEGEKRYREHACARPLPVATDDVARPAASSSPAETVNEALTASGIIANLCQVDVRSPEDAAALVDLVRAVHALMVDLPEQPTAARWRRPMARDRRVIRAAAWRKP